MLTQVRPYVLPADAERTLKPGDSFKECAKDCPEMVVVPAGTFMMGAPATDRGRISNEVPQHKVTIPKPFAVSKFAVTFSEWDACVSVGRCPRIDESYFGRDMKPVIGVSWDDVQQYAAWLSEMTGRAYRLLTEAEWEYAARAGTKTAYFWGDEIGKGNANCIGCGSKWDNEQTSPVNSFKPNAFGLYDMHGNVWQWVQDCYHPDYKGAPTDASAWATVNCNRFVGRGGSWNFTPLYLRAAYRRWFTVSFRDYHLGVRIARTLLR
jgi:formylglycine-generating enzyme required for sulfatase activity